MDDMSEDKPTRQTSISDSRTEEEIADFWDSHSLDDCWEETREAAFEVRAQRRRRITLDPEVYADIEAQARARGLMPETLANLWLKERIQAGEKQAS